MRGRSEQFLPLRRLYARVTKLCLSYLPRLTAMCGSHAQHAYDVHSLPAIRSQVVYTECCGGLHERSLPQHILKSVIRIDFQYTFSPSRDHCALAKAVQGINAKIANCIGLNRHIWQLDVRQCTSRIIDNTDSVDCLRLILV